MWLVGGYSADVLNIIKEKVFFLLFNKSFLKPSFAVWDLGESLGMLVECVTLHLTSTKILSDTSRNIHEFFFH